MEPAGTRLVVYSDENPEFSIWAVADIHFGNVGCAKHRLSADVQRIAKDPYAIWSLLGDWADFISVDDKRWDPEAVDESELSIRDLADMGAVLEKGIEKFLLPIKDKCLGAGFGNHEEKYMRAKAQASIHDELCKALECANLKYSAFYDVYFERDPQHQGPPLLIKRPAEAQVRKSGQRKITIFQHHGFGAAQTPGGKLGAVKKMVENVVADLVMMGHLHEQIAKAFAKLCTDMYCREIRERLTMGLMSGSYLRGYMPGVTLYSEKKGYHPTTLGATRARFRPTEGVLTVENRADGVGEKF
jgi:predicted MPP superfamily phosphohydrolase